MVSFYKRDFGAGFCCIREILGFVEISRIFYRDFGAGEVC